MSRTWQFLRRVVCATLIVALLPVPFAYGQRAVEPADGEARPGPGVVVENTEGETRATTRPAALQRTLGLLGGSGWKPELMELPGFAPAEDSALRWLSPAESRATTMAQGARDGRAPWMPWWAWALVGAGAAFGISQLEFGDDDDDELDDDS